AIAARINPALLPKAGGDSSPEDLAEANASSDFLADSRIGPRPVPSGKPGAEQPAATDPTPEAVEAETDPLKTFLTLAPKQVQLLRNLSQEIGGGPPEAERQELLKRLGEGLHQFKGMAGLPDVLPAWQMASALERLVKQLVEKANRVGPSTLLTVANGVEVLGELCRPGLRGDLCTNPPIRLLAVDDDAISRHALSFALRKGVGQPDLAEHGPGAVVLAARQAYDVIFMDVQMPGMDGFEVCSKIHDTALNRHTPVVFVTVHSDFNARAKSTVCGGNDLIGKPFLPFEITVKALTLAMRARLGQSESSAEKTGACLSDHEHELPCPKPASPGSAPSRTSSPLSSSALAVERNVHAPSPGQHENAPQPSGTMPAGTRLA